MPKAKNKKRTKTKFSKHPDPHWTEAFIVEDPDNPLPQEPLDDSYWAELERLIAKIPEEEALRIEAALKRQQLEQKDLMRRRMFGEK
jgi:hypothetical protein